MQKPQSRNEAILQSMIADTEYTDPPQSRIESLLLQLKEVIEAGGGEIVVDDEISTTSTHPVQNKVIAANLLSAIAGITPNSSGSMELDSEDLNDFTTSGIYNAMNCENAPFNDMALVILGYSMDGYCVQIACDVASGNFKFRNQIDGNWTAWGDNILSTLEAHTAAINELENNTKSIQTATGNPLTIESSESNLVECTAEVEAVQEGSGDPSPTNIRPIIGQTEVVIEDAGKNQCPQKDTSANNGILNLTNNGIFGDVVANQTYTLSFDVLVTNIAQVQLKLNNVQGSIGAWSSGELVANQRASMTFTASENGSINFWAYNAYNSSGTIKVFDNIQLELGNTATTFEPYKGKTYTIQLGNTIYGGELDVVAGKMRVNKVKRQITSTIGTGWQAESGREHSFYVYDNAFVPSAFSGITVKDDARFVCDTFPTVTPTDCYDGNLGVAKEVNRLRLGNPSWSTVSDVTSYLSNNEVYIVYELAEPYTIQLTPQQIRLLKGTNNISCNTGDLSIKYYPDNVLGQLKGDIESEYDERVETLETQMVGRPELKSLTITNKLTSNDGVAVINELPKAIIVGAYLYNTSNNNTVIAIPYLASSGNLPFLKICSDSSTLSVLSGISVSGIIYYFEI